MAMLTYVEHVPAPVLTREHTVVLDRLSSHRDLEVARAVRRSGTPCEPSQPRMPRAGSATVDTNSLTSSVAAQVFTPNTQT